jgi:hypothetical protein
MHLRIGPMGQCELRDEGILRTSPFGHSAKFATRKPRPSNNKDSPLSDTPVPIRKYARHVTDKGTP